MSYSDTAPLGVGLGLGGGAVAPPITTSASVRGCTSKLPYAKRTTPVIESTTVPVSVPPTRPVMCVSVSSSPSSSCVGPLPSSISISP